MAFLLRRDRPGFAFSSNAGKAPSLWLRCFAAVAPRGAPGRGGRGAGGFWGAGFTQRHRTPLAQSSGGSVQHGQTLLRRPQLQRCPSRWARGHRSYLPPVPRARRGAEAPASSLPTVIVVYGGEKSARSKAKHRVQRRRWEQQSCLRKVN